VTILSRILTSGQSDNGIKTLTTAAKNISSLLDHILAMNMNVYFLLPTIILIYIWKLNSGSLVRATYALSIVCIVNFWYFDHLLINNFVALNSRILVTIISEQPLCIHDRTAHIFYCIEHTYSFMLHVIV